MRSPRCEGREERDISHIMFREELRARVLHPLSSENGSGHTRKFELVARVNEKGKIVLQDSEFRKTIHQQQKQTSFEVLTFAHVTWAVFRATFVMSYTSLSNVLLVCSGVFGTTPPPPHSPSCLSSPPSFPLPSSPRHPPNQFFLLPFSNSF